MNKKAYIVTESGNKLPIDTSNISENQFIPEGEIVGLYTEDAELSPIWILELYKQTNLASIHKNREYEWLKDITYDHKPTKEEILYAMSANGISRWGFVTIRKGYELG